MNKETILRILAAYGVSPQQLLAAQSGYRNQSWPVMLADGRLLNLIIYKREPAMATTIMHANAIGDFLAEHGLPTRQTANKRIMQMQSGEYVRYAGLYQYLPGSTIPWDAYTMRHLKLVGAAISDMHALLRLPQAPVDLPSIADRYMTILMRMAVYFDDSGVRAAFSTRIGSTLVPEGINRLLDLLEICRNLPNQQPLHMDFVRGNILFDGEQETLHVSGIIDFEKAALGHPVFDIARTLSFLLVDCKFKPEHKVRKYFLQSGYNKRGAATFDGLILFYKGQRIDVLERLIDMFLLHDFYKFLRHNPYESLSQNEHFVRTRDLLVARKMLQ